LSLVVVVLLLSSHCHHRVVDEAGKKTQPCLRERGEMSGREFTHDF